jgi:hypothetical protein
VASATCTGRTNRRERARDHLTTAASTYSEIDMRFWLEKVEAPSHAPA